MITSLLQVVNRLAASCELHAGLMQVVSSTCSESANIKLQQVGCSQTRCNLMKSTGLIQLVDNLHQAGKIHNLRQVCGVFGCVQEAQSWPSALGTRGGKNIFLSGTVDSKSKNFCQIVFFLGMELAIKYIALLSSNLE